MKFTGVIALFVAVATAAPILDGAVDGVVGTAGGLVSDPGAAVAKVEDTANGLVGGVEKTANGVVGGAENMVNGLVGSVGKTVGDLAKPVTGTLGGVLGGLKN